MVGPERIEFEFTTNSWAPGTHRKTAGRAVTAPTTMEEFEKVKDRLKGAWIISTTPRRRGEPSDVDKAIQGSGVVGWVAGSPTDLVVTGGAYKIDWNNLPTETRVLIRKKDMDAIQSKLADGKGVELEFEIDNRFIVGEKQGKTASARQELHLTIRLSEIGLETER